MNLLSFFLGSLLVLKCTSFVPAPGTWSDFHVCKLRSFDKGTALHTSSKPPPSSSASTLLAASTSFTILSFLNSQSFTYLAGGLGLTAILLNRLAILDLTVSDFQSRLDLIATMAASALLLNALTQQEIETKERDSISLVGYSCTSTLVNPNIDASSKESESHYQIMFTSLRMNESIYHFVLNYLITH